MIIKETYTIPGSTGRPMLADLTYDDANPTAPLVIFAHGIRGFKDWGTHNLVADHFAANGFRFLKFNFSHNGTTVAEPTEFADLIAFGENTFSIELDDLGSVIDFACSGSATPPANGVYLIGHSMGGGISIIKTAEDTRVKRLVTMAAISSFYNLWPKQSEEQWKLQGVMYMRNGRTGQDMPYKVDMLRDLEKHPERLNICRKASAVPQPWFIVHGDKDTSVPLSHAEELRAANPQAKYLVIDGADHVFNASHPYLENDIPEPLRQFCDQAIGFFKK